MGGWARSISTETGGRTLRNLYASFVNPNARCPVCFASVFYYQSSSGGRVFFDELGPPWPKHPCTDSGRPFLRTDPETVRTRQLYWWEEQGWSPFLRFAAGEFSPTLLRVTGYLADNFTTLYLPKGALPRRFNTVVFTRSMCHLKKIREGVFVISWLLADASTLELEIFSSTLEAERRQELLGRTRPNEGPRGRVRRARA